MLIKTKNPKRVLEFLKKEIPLNLNIIGIIENMPHLDVFVDDLENPRGVLVKNGYMHYLYTRDDGFIEKLRDYFKDGFYGFSAVEASIAEKIKKQYPIHWNNPCQLYYFPHNVVDVSKIKNKTQNVDVKDAEIIDEYYTYRGSGSLERIKKDIMERPSSGIYVNGELVCWCLVHEDNSIGIMYTKEEHRKKGYAVDVSLSLISKVLEGGNTPFLQIVEGNEMSPGLAEKCGFVKWGEVTWFGIIAGSPKELMETQSQAIDKLYSLMNEGELQVLKPITNNSLYILLNNIELEDNDNLYVEEALAMEDSLLWWDIVKSSYNNVEEHHLKTYENLVSHRDFTMLLIKNNNGVIAAAGMLKLDDESCGLYFLSSSQLDKGFLYESIKKALSYGKNTGYEVVYTHTCNERIQLFKEIGFISLG